MGNVAASVEFQSFEPEFSVRDLEIRYVRHRAPDGKLNAYTLVFTLKGMMTLKGIKCRGDVVKLL